MMTVLIVYRCLIAIFVYSLYFTHWFHRMITQWFYRHCYTIRVNIDVIRHHQFLPWQNPSMDKIQFNKPTEVVALIINEQIADSDLCQLIINSILFFRRLNIEHLIIYDYQGSIKAHQALIMDYVHSHDKKIPSSHLLPTIHFQSLIDCSQTLTRVAQELCTQVQQGQLNSDAIQIDTVDQCYTKISGLSEINLAVIVGSIKSAFGLHPWLTRLTEFITIDSYKQLSSNDAFLTIVQRYNRIEQRQGR